MKAIAICEANPTEGDACLDLQAQLGDILLSLGDLDGAERVVREVNERKGVKFSHKMGRVLRAKGKYVEAISQYTQVLDAKRSKLPPDHPDLGFELNAISITYELMGDLESAIDYAEQAAQVRRHYGAGSAMATGMLLRVAGLYARAGDLERAEAPFREAWPALVQNPDWIGHAIFKLGGQDPTRTRDAVDSFVTLLRNIGQEKAAEDLVVWAAGVAQGS